jgi:secondary thiamine-phosphate synthase enzyme
MHQHQEELRLATPGRGLVDLTAQVRQVVGRAEVNTGQVTVFCQHTSASLVVQENADPSARSDLMAWLARIAPEQDPSYTHTAEGPDDMPSHLRAAVTSTSETIPVLEGDLALGTWQGLFLLEHRDVPHTRNLIVHVVGE